MMDVNKKLDVDYRVIKGDCIDVMRAMDECSVDSVITDPPYGLAFMGKAWDHAVPGVEYWTEVLRVLKPGGHMVAFGGTRLFHRLTCAIEDSGFEIRDCIMWVYGTGFPKSHDVSKSIDKAAGAERGEGVVSGKSGSKRSCMAGDFKGGEYRKTDPITPAAEQWQGWGTALKPAWEPIIVARKPFKGTVAGNILKHGTGALNIDGCRVGDGSDRVSGDKSLPGAAIWGFAKNTIERPRGGRWPANVILSHHPECEFVGYKKVKAISGGSNPVRRHGVHSEAKGHQTPGRDQTHCSYGDDEGNEAVEDWKCHKDCPMGMFPETKPSKVRPPTGKDDRGVSGFTMRRHDTKQRGHSDIGGSASRFFYCAKASKSERGEGNDHPTVKPLTLMKWLCRLITPPKGVVLDPFCGSGSTLVAAIEEGFESVGIEYDERYVKISEDRVSNIKPVQQGLDLCSPKSILKMRRQLGF